MGQIKKRDSNFELLRIVAMLLIVLHHLMVHGVFKGFDYTTMSGNQSLTLLFASGGKVGVAIFMMITGYFMANKNMINVNALSKLWLQVFIYLVGIFGVLTYLGLLTADGNNRISNFLPLIFNRYCFFTDYFLIVLMAPLVNGGIAKLDQKTLNTILFPLIIFWFVVPSVTPYVFHQVKIVAANDFVLMVVFYIIGAYIKKFNLVVINSVPKSLMIFLGGLILTVGSQLFFTMQGNKLHSTDVTYLANEFYRLNSINVLILAIGLFGVFKNINIGEVRWINIIASATFGVYLIHDNAYIRPMLWQKLLDATHLLGDGVFGFVYQSVLIVLVVFSVCVTIDLARKVTIGRLTDYVVDRFIK